MDGLIEKHCDQSLEYTEIGFITQHPLCCPIKTNVFVVVFHIVPFLLQTYEKKLRISPNGYFLQNIKLSFWSKFAFL